MDARRHLVAALVVGLVFAVVMLAITPFGAPRSAPSSAPDVRFSSARAMDHLRAIAKEPRPIGSAGSAAAADHIRRYLERLGLSPRVQRAEVVSPIDARVAGVVHNVIGRLPGSDPSRAVLLMTHYDSVPNSAGVADDGSGVATLLETARAVRAGPRPRNDIIFLFTGGEEQGLLGARAFLRDHPWADVVGVVVDFDSPGSSSPALMYETSPGNGLLVREYVAATDPFASSLMYEVSRRQRIVGDFQLFLARGIPGMTFGMLDGPGYYHTAYDSLASFDEDALQHSGETALSLARRFGAVDLRDLRRPDVVYFNVIGDVAVVYAQSLVVPFVAVAVLLFAAAVAVAARRRLLSLRGLALAVLGTAATLAASALVTAVSWWMYETAYQERVWTRTGVVVSDWYRVGLVLLASAVVLGMYGFLLRRLRAWDLVIAAAAWWAAGAVVVSRSFPGASFLLTWPLVGGSLGLIGAALVERRQGGRPAAAAIALAGALPGVALMSSAVYLLLMSAGLKQGITVLAVWLLSGLLMLPLSLVERAFRIWPPVVLAVLGAVVLFAVGSTVAYDAEHPKFTSVYYRVMPGGRPVWQAIDRLDDYTRAYVRPPPGDPPVESYFPDIGMRQTRVGTAPYYGLTAPRLTLLSDRTDGDRRTVRVRLRPTREVAAVSLLVHTVVGALTASVDGHELGGRDTTLLDGTTVRWVFDFYAPPPEGVVVTLGFAAGRRVLLRAVDFAHGLPAGAPGYPSRPPGMLAGAIGDGSLTETKLRLPRSPAALD
ncbi:MAG: M20/M25/M40 family metallo-hydrolase [Actinobacteria bacterium]|nr:M20/M25/M40 family metallo-hydrolase [Actinomycetota bacterium]